MAILWVQPETTHRDWDDVVKFPGRFSVYAYDGADEEPPEVWDLTHRVQWATVAAAAGGGSMLEQFHRYLAVKNMGTDPVLLHLNTAVNLPNPEFEVTILPGHWVEYADLFMSVQPSIRVDSALYSSPVECEVLQIGEFTPIEEIPEQYCDLWAVGRETDFGALTRHNPEATATNWDTIACPALADPQDYTLWLADVAGVAIDDYWAVGYTVGVTPGGVFAFWNDVAWAWTVINGEPPQYGVWGFATADFYSVGGGAGVAGVIWHGPAWALTSTPDPDGHETLFCVHGHHPDYVWAAGMDGLIVTGNHGAGFVVSQAANLELDENYYGVYSASATDQWVVGGTEVWWGAAGGTGVIRRNQLAGWTVQTTSCPTLRAIWGFGDSDLWAVGDQGTILHSGDGNTWDVVPAPAEIGSNYHFRGVFGCRPWAVWAVGTSMTGDHVTIFWDGATWEIDDGPNDEGDLLGLKGVWHTP